jgi:hypothetical protein
MVEHWNNGFLNTTPSFHYSIIAAAQMSFPFQPPNQHIYLNCKIRNHDDEKHQKKSIRIDDPQNIHLPPPFIN